MKKYENPLNAESGGQMKKSHYRVILIPAFICTAIIVFLAFYSVGVIGRSDARELIGERLELVCENIDQKTASAEKLTKEIYNGYRSKARVVSMMLSKNTNIFNDEASFEEMRVAIGADIISVADEKGIIRYSTDMSAEETSVLEEFMPAIENKVFSEAVLTESGGRRGVVTGSARLDEPGVIQIRFSIESYQQLDLTDISTFVTQMPIMNHGHLAVIDTATNTYVSHTDSFLNGSAVQFSPEEFSEDSGWFSSEYDGKRVLVKYKKHNDMIVAGIVPYSEIYQRRNSVIKWILFSMSALTVVSLLAMRNYDIKAKSA